MAKARFEWDSEKDRDNQKKHGVSFASAQFAFADPNRVIAEDLSHSGSEKRYYCFGRVEGGIMTEHGTHIELLKKNGVYARLFKLQAKGYQ